MFAEREGFEPPEPFSSTVFKTAVIDHSTISPRTFRWDVPQTDCKGKQFFWFCKYFMKILHQIEKCIKMKGVLWTITRLGGICG